MKKIFISLLLLTIILPSLTACAYFHDGKISQDKLPWKKSGEVLQEVDFTRRTLNWEEVNNVYELKRSSDQGYFMSVFPKNGRSISTSNLVFSDTKFSVEAKKRLPVPMKLAMAWFVDIKINKIFMAFQFRQMGMLEYIV